MTISAADGTWTLTSDNWPWPRMFITSYYVLVVTVDGTDLSLYELVNDSDTWTATKVCVLGTLARIDSVSVADFGKYYILSAFGYDSDNELWTRVIQRIPNASPALTAVEDISSGDMPHGTAVCNYKGQIIVGGLKSNNQKWLSLGTCAVAYGAAGTGEFDPENDPMAGFNKMPWDVLGQGKIYAVYRLGNFIIVYGERGVEKLTPLVNEIITGFGQETIGKYGALGFNCIGHSKDSHCYIDTNYDLNLITDKVTNLGYRRFMSQLDSTKIIISYEPSKGYFYISDNLLCFVLTEHGLYSTHQCVSSIGKYGNIFCGFILSNADTKIRLETTEFNVLENGDKTIENIEMHVGYATDTDILITGRTKIRYDYNGDLITLPWVNLNTNGILTQVATGRTFKIGLESDYDSAGEFNFSGIDLKIKYSDKRNRRGDRNVR